MLADPTTVPDHLSENTHVHRASAYSRGTLTSADTARGFGCGASHVHDDEYVKKLLGSLKVNFADSKALFLAPQWCSLPGWELASKCFSHATQQLHIMYGSSIMKEVRQRVADFLTSMLSPAMVRRCQEKIAFPSHDDATVALKEFQRNGRRQKIPIYIYKCPVCRKFHHTSRGRKIYGTARLSDGRRLVIHEGGRVTITCHDGSHVFLTFRWRRPSGGIYRARAAAFAGTSIEKVIVEGDDVKITGLSFEDPVTHEFKTLSRLKCATGRQRCALLNLWALRVSVDEVYHFGMLAFGVKNFIARTAESALYFAVRSRDSNRLGFVVFPQMTDTTVRECVLVEAMLDEGLLGSTDDVIRLFFHVGTAGVDRKGRLEIRVDEETFKPSGPIFVLKS